MQAEAAGVKPSVLMNPILLKPTNDVGSQVIVKGEVLGNMRARDYFAYKKKLIPTICEAFSELEKQADIIVMEGAGSPAEINLKSDDIVNMGLAKLVDAPVLLVGDIDRGGVFAQLLGTLMLLEEDEKARVKGLIINKFRGDKTILDPGVKMLEERSGVKVAGVVPYMHLSIEDEDSLVPRNLLIIRPFTRAFSSSSKSIKVPKSCANTPPRSISPTRSTGASTSFASPILTISSDFRLISAGLPAPSITIMSACFSNSEKSLADRRNQLFLIRKIIPRPHISEHFTLYDHL